eukprot:8365555-Pyramimonas_sp.AAC.1
MDQSDTISAAIFPRWTNPNLVGDRGDRDHGRRDDELGRPEESEEHVDEHMLQPSVDGELVAALSTRGRAVCEPGRGRGRGTLHIRRQQQPQSHAAITQARTAALRLCRTP